MTPTRLAASVRLRLAGPPSAMQLERSLDQRLLEGAMVIFALDGHSCGMRGGEGASRAAVAQSRVEGKSRFEGKWARRPLPNPPPLRGRGSRRRPSSKPRRAQPCSGRTICSFSTCSVPESISCKQHLIAPEIGEMAAAPCEALASSSILPSRDAVVQHQLAIAGEIDVDDLDVGRIAADVVLARRGCGADRDSRARRGWRRPRDAAARDRRRRGTAATCGSACGLRNCAMKLSSR